MKKQISVIDLVQASHVKKKAHMILKLFTVPEGCFQPLHNFQFSCSKLIGMFPVNGGKQIVPERIFLSVRHDNASLFRINSVKKAAILHMKFPAFP